MVRSGFLFPLFLALNGVSSTNGAVKFKARYKLTWRQPAAAGSSCAWSASEETAAEGAVLSFFPARTCPSPASRSGNFDWFNRVSKGERIGIVAGQATHGKAHMLSSLGVAFPGQTVLCNAVCLLVEWLGVATAHHNSLKYAALSTALPGSYCVHYFLCSGIHVSNTKRQPFQLN